MFSIEALLIWIVDQLKRPLLTGTILGFGAGVMALIAPNFMNLNKNYVKKSDKQKWITVAYYIMGGVVAGIVANTVKE